MDILSKYNIKYCHFDILSDDEVRQGMPILFYATSFVFVIRSSISDIKIIVRNYHSVFLLNTQMQILRLLKFKLVGVISLLSGNFCLPFLYSDVLLFCHGFRVSIWDLVPFKALSSTQKSENFLISGSCRPPKLFKILTYVINSLGLSVQKGCILEVVSGSELFNPEFSTDLFKEQSATNCSL